MQHLKEKLQIADSRELTAKSEALKQREENLRLSQELEALKEKSAEREKQYQENIESMVTSERSFHQQQVENSSSSNAYRKIAEDAEAATNRIQHSLELSQAEYVAMDEIQKRQAQEIEMLQADVCNAVEQHDRLALQLQERERSNDIILAQLEAAQLKSSQESRKRYDLERTVRRMNSGIAGIVPTSATRGSAKTSPNSSFR